MVLEPLETEGTGSVALLEVTRIAFVSLLSNKVRSILSMLGVIIGVGSVVALLACVPFSCTAAPKPVMLLNASYDPTRTKGVTWKRPYPTDTAVPR